MAAQLEMYSVSQRDVGSMQLSLGAPWGLQLGRLQMSVRSLAGRTGRPATSAISAAAVAAKRRTLAGLRAWVWLLYRGTAPQTVALQVPFRFVAPENTCPQLSRALVQCCPENSLTMRKALLCTLPPNRLGEERCFPHGWLGLGRTHCTVVPKEYLRLRITAPLDESSPHVAHQQAKGGAANCQERASAKSGRGLTSTLPHGRESGSEDRQECERVPSSGALPE